MSTPQPGNSKSDSPHASNEADRTLPPKQPPAVSPATVAPVQDAVATLPPQSAPSSSPGPTLIGIGAMLGPYKLLDKLGEGGMGAVYKARHQHLDKMVAVKVLSQQFTSHEDAVSRFKREMKAVGKLTHANIVQAFDAGEIEGTHFLAMELVEGTDLYRLVKEKGPFTPANACRAVRQAAIALAAAHAAGLIHRDIKPSNLLVAKNGQIKLLDLGLARLAGEAGKATDLTAAGQAFGTPDYMAPEQWEDAREADPRTDLYALGCTLFFLLTGRAPFEDDKHQSTVSKMTAHVLDAVPDLQAARRDVPDGVAAIYQRLVAKQPADRFQSATELAEALHPYASGKTTAPAAEPPGAPKPQNAPSASNAVPPADLAAQARSAKELLDMHCYQEAIALLEEVPGAENIPGMREILFEARQRQFEVNNLLAAIGQQMRQKNRAGRQQLRASLERLRVLKPQHKEFEAQLAQLERAEHGRLHIPLPGLKEPLDIPWAAAIPALIVAGTMLAMGLWVIVRDKDGKEVARVPVPEGGSATVTTDDSPSASDKADKSGWQGWPANTPPPAIAPFDAAKARQHQEAWAKHLGVPVEYTNTLGMKFVLIPPGEFTMGSTQEEIDANLKDFPPDEDFWRKHFPSEAPRHKVILTNAIYMGVHQVTQENYEAVTGKNPSFFANTGKDPKKAEKVAGLDTAHHAVEGTSWYDATEFCAKLCEKESLKPFYAREGNGVKMLAGNGYRLPTEAEWEFACRGGTITKYWIDDSNDLNRIGWLGANSGLRTHAVGELPGNPLGLFDMHGNVWQWVEDGWEPTSYAQFADMPAINPSNFGNPSAPDSQRVMRGGNHNDGPLFARSAARGSFHPSYRTPATGFRVVLTVDAVKAAQAAAIPRPAPNAPPLDTALQFDGDDVVDIAGLAFDPQGSYTLEGFITKPAKADKGAGFVFGMPEQSYLSFTKGGDWRWVYAPKQRKTGLEISIAGAVARQARTHLACVRDGQTHRLYVDGKLFRKTAEVESPVVGTSPFQIGPEFRGVIDEVRVSKISRYQADFTPPERFAPDANTLGLYHFDEAAGDVLKDSSAHNHHGKISGATWVRADGSPIK